MHKLPEPKSPGLLEVWEHLTLEDGLSDLKAKHPAHLRCLGLGCAILLLATSGAAQTFFTQVTDQAMAGKRFIPRGLAWGDYDNDGWPDLFFGENFRFRIALFHGSHVLASNCAPWARPCSTRWRFAPAPTRPGWRPWPGDNSRPGCAEPASQL